MAPGLSTNMNNHEETIAKVYETLKRTKNRTLETKLRAAKTIEGSSQYLNNSKVFHKSTYNPDRFLSESMTCKSGTGKQENHTFAQLGYSTVDNKRISNPMQAGLIPHVSRNNVQQLSHGAEDKRKAPANNNKLRTIMFKTLDRLFQVPSKSSSRSSSAKNTQTRSNQSSENISNSSALSLETLRLLNQNAADTLPRDIVFPLPKNQILSTENVGSKTRHDLSSDDSSSDDDSCWEYIAPLKFEEVELDDTLQLETPKDIDNGKENDKARTGSLKFNAVVHINMPEKITDKAVKLRKDSPIQNRRTLEKPFITSSNSLPHLMEAIQDLEGGSSSECGTDTFKRNISYCPSSTLCKSVPSFSENHENDDDACSTSSSFSSLQMVPTYYSTTRSTHESTLPVPSALCKDVLVRPINVSIQPIKCGENEVEVTGITPQAFKELSEVYVPAQGTKIVNNDDNEPAMQIIHQITKNAEVEASSDSQKSPTSSGLSSSNTSLPPPPPPPMPPSESIASNTIRGLLPLPVFTQCQTGNCVFNYMEDIQIDGEDAKKLKEKFPLKSGRNALKRLRGRDNTQCYSPEEINFLRNIEVFLKTCRISKEDTAQVIKNVVESILALDANRSNVKTEWFVTLTQSLPKIEKMRENQNLQKFGNKTAAEVLMLELLRIENFHAKLMCIQFSLDFKDGSTKLSKWANSFIGDCEAIKMSDKFVSIINVIMGLLQSLNPDDHSKIYGFDIQGLTKLATRTSEDGSSTFLQFVIEYILNKPHLIDSIDFYKTFKDLPDVTKTSIKEMKAQGEEWKQSLNKFKIQVEKIQRDNHIPSFDLQHATTFLVQTDKKLEQLNEKLYEAKQSFNSCKERFGLMNSETSEVFFFESLSKFIMAYQKTYNEIIAQKQKVSKQSTVKNNRRTSLFLLRQENSPENDSSSSNIATRRKSCSAVELDSMKVAQDHSEKSRQPPIAKPRRKSCKSKEIQDILSTPENTEINKCLLNLLTNDESDNGRPKRDRKRFGNLLSKLPRRTLD